MSDLADFLAARLDERATDADQIHNVHADKYGECYASSPGGSDCGEPEYVLADVAAKRGILRRYVNVAQGLAASMERINTGQRPGSAVISERDLLSTNCAALFMAVKLLAMPFADHPDHDPSWRIE